MSEGKFSVVAIAPAYNEGENIETILRSFPAGVVDQIVIVNDASSDDTGIRARHAGAHVIDHPRRMGCGPAIRTGLDYALKNNFDIAVIIAGNGKDDPRQIDRILGCLQREGADLVQGSRYWDGGYWTNMPLHRQWGTRLYSFLFSCLCGKRITDGTNGFRALRTSLLKDSRINLWQDWLNNYEVESYLLFKSIRLGYRVREVGVSKLYPPGKPRGYTKMRPFLDWWSHFRPALLLRLGIKK